MMKQHCITVERRGAYQPVIPRFNYRLTLEKVMEVTRGQQGVVCLPSVWLVERLVATR